MPSDWSYWNALSGLLPPMKPWPSSPEQVTMPAASSFHRHFRCRRIFRQSRRSSRAPKRFRARSSRGSCRHSTGRQSRRVVAFCIDIHGRPAALDESARFVGTHKAAVTRGGGGIGVEPAAAHIASADDTVVPSCNAAHHAADVRRDIAADDRAVLDHAVVIERENCRRV